MSDYLTDEEQIDKLQRWWQENGKSLIVGVVVIVGGVIGWRWYEDANTEQIEAASALYETFVQSEGEDRLAAASRLDEEAAGSSYQVFALFHLARQAADEDDLETASSHLENAVAAAPNAVLGDIARLRLARLLQQRDQTDAALTTLGAVKSEGFRSHVAELKGDIHMTRGELSLAHEAYTAARDELAEGEVRPLLEMKIADTAHAGDA